MLPAPPLLICPCFLRTHVVVADDFDVIRSAAITDDEMQDVAVLFVSDKGVCSIGQQGVHGAPGPSRGCQKYRGPRLPVQGVNTGTLEQNVRWYEIR